MLRARGAAALAAKGAAFSRRCQSTVGGTLERMDGLTNIIATDKYGFNVNGIHMRGSIIAFSNFTLLWNCLRVADASPRNLAVVHAVRPKPDILFIGTGDDMQNINPSLYGYFSRKGVAIEPMSTTNAIASFNLLNQEGRNAAVALVCRSPVSRADACLYTEEARTLAAAPAERALVDGLSGATTELLLANMNEGPRLLEGGRSPSDGPARPTAPPPKGPVVHAPALREVELASRSVALQYGYPGALPPDASPVRPAAAGRTAVPRTADEMLDAIARRGDRRSGAGLPARAVPPSRKS